MADWSKPNTAGSDAYTSTLTYLDARLNDAATAFVSTPTNPIDGMIRWNRSTSKFEEYDTGTVAWVAIPLSLAGGGTGAVSASAARTALGLGSLAVQDSSAVTITAGTITASVLSGVVPTTNLGSGTANSSTFLRGDQTYAALSGIPAGFIFPYGGASAPTGYLLCDGAAVNRTTYATLFAVIGTTYGVGNGSTTFNIPDCRGRFLLCKSAAGTGSTLGTKAGSLDHYHTIAGHDHAYTEVVQHVHDVNITDPNHQHAIDAPTVNTTSSLSGTDAGITVIDSIGSTGVNTTAVATGITASSSNPAGSVASGTTASGGSGSTSETNPAYIVINAIISI